MTSAKKQYGAGNHTVLYGVWTVDSLHHSRDSLNHVLHADNLGCRLLRRKHGDDSLYVRLHLQRKYFLRK